MGLKEQGGEWPPKGDSLHLAQISTKFLPPHELLSIKANIWFCTIRQALGVSLPFKKNSELTQVNWKEAIQR